jgi:competence ComEA-like helix-hairpin-helix protein
MKAKNYNHCTTYTIMLEFLVLILLGFLLSACVRSHTKQEFTANGGKLSAETAVNINTASLEELENLPHIGEGFARKIIEHRESHGKFRRAEHLLLIEGISERRFQQIRHRIKVE